MSVAAYPVHVDATLDRRMSRWLWLVKWFLSIPHYVVLAFLWLAFVGASVVAFVAILVTGRYPRGLFDFNVGVLRWSWRVAYYTYGALGTDRYPPFTLADVPDYPAHFDVDYPANLSRGLVLVKWWLLAIPHYLVVGVFLGGGTWALWQTTGHGAGAPGLIGLLVLIAAVALAFTGRYPEQIFDFVLGMNRWALRVAAYAGLMTDRYPPFRLDLGGHESSGTITLAPSTPTATEPAPPRPGRKRGWTVGRVVSVVVGCILGLAALGVLGSAGVATWATNHRDAAGFLTTGTRTFVTPTKAVTSENIDLGRSTDWITPADALGTVRIRATAADPATAVFVGVAPRAAAERYLRGLPHLVVTTWAGGTTQVASAVGAGSATGAPTSARIWTAQATGRGTQTLSWRPAGGQWVIVVMNADGRAGVSVSADVGATVPDLAWAAAALFALGAVLLVSAVTLVAVPVSRAG